MQTILIIEDEEAIRRVLVKILKEEEKYHILEASNGLLGLQSIKENEIDLVICDIKMPKMDGIEVLQEVKKIKPEIPFIMISGHGDLDTAVSTMRLGAFDYISKPPDLNRLFITIRNALENKNLSSENHKLKKRISKKYDIIGTSAPITEVKKIIEKVAPTTARVLITGPNGSGKELVANGIYQQSQRNKKPLIEINCAAIPSELIESELFGHVKGAFTSANKDRAGKFELANGGTLFLDEIGEMSLSAQAKVLRALQEHKIQRVGSDKSIKVDVRIIAATNKNLVEEVAAKRFREDLYHRLAVIVIKVPSLNERKEDIPLLSKHFLKKIAKEQGNAPKDIEAKALKALEKINWTGNIRELHNVIERLTILGDNPITEKNVITYTKNGI